MESPDSNCPFCQSQPATSYTPQLHLCRSCGIAYNSAHSPLSYDKNYFLDEYKKQYGKTYTEDFENIYRMSMERMNVILGLTRHRKKMSFLDIGSALGFFLKCARDMGADRVRGIEISEYAARYAQKEFGIETVSMPFDDVSLDERFDVITAWYFLEHCADPRAVIKKIHDALVPGGVFAFSVPSIFGPLFSFHRREWISSRPVDHRVDFTPRGAGRILKREGFRHVKVRTAGIHPERMLRSNHPLYRPFAFAYGVLAPLFGFSDTIEIYAVK